MSKTPAGVARAERTPERTRGREDENMMDKKLLRSPGIFSGLLQVFVVKSVIIQVVAKKTAWRIMAD